MGARRDYDMIFSAASGVPAVKFLKFRRDSISFCQI
jgi:hypothetical protein